jgi:hypothetical protein
MQVQRFCAGRGFADYLAANLLDEFDQAAPGKA